MALALAFTLLAVGAMFVYIGWKGIAFAEFWQRLLGGRLSE